MKILLVEDEPDVARIAQASLSLVGKFEVVLAGTGRQALELAAREKPDAILLDVMLPEMDGTAVLALLRADPALRGIPVIFLTARIPPDREQYLALGARGVIAKPFDPMDLPNRVREILA